MAAGPVVALERGLVTRRVVWRVAPWLMRVTGGRLARTLPFPADVLETRDARDGRPHRRVVVYLHDGPDQVIVIASKAGMRDHPFWYMNAVADPDVVLGGQPFRAAVVEDPVQRARIWSVAERFYPPNAVHRTLAARHGREIPVLRLTPR